MLSLQICFLVTGINALPGDCDWLSPRATQPDRALLTDADLAELLFGDFGCRHIPKVRGGEYRYGLWEADIFDEGW